MNKLFISALAIAVPALSGMAIRPAEVNPTGKVQMAMQKTLKAPQARATADNNRTFFEDFEDRPFGFTISCREWLPQGWSEFSKVGLTATNSTGGNNITWQTLDNENKSAWGPIVQPYAYEGDVFAYIMADVAYDQHTDLQFQDEWLVTPSITPVGEDWLHFKLWLRPGWVTYNRDTNNFDGLNNSLQVYASEDNGENWTLLWDLVEDHINVNYTEDELRDDLAQWNRSKYDPVYVNIKKYLNKEVKFAFRYYGRLGQPMAIDNVAVSVPMPVSSYTLPGSALYQGISPTGNYPVSPRLYVPDGVELNWTNTSTDVMVNEWTFHDADGTLQTSPVRNLVTPAYAMGSEHPTPVLKGSFESRVSEPYQSRFTKLQAGGLFTGTDDSGYEGEFATCNYDITDPTHKVRISPNHIALSPYVDENWETILGRMPETLDIDGILNFYKVEPGHPYGFDYVEFYARVEEDFDDNAVLTATVFAVDETGAPTGIIGKTSLKGSELPKAQGSDHFNMIRMDFDVPVYACTDFFVMLSNPCRDSNGNVLFTEGNHISLCYVTTQDPTIGNNSYLYFWAYADETGWQENFGNLISYPSSNQFAGICMNIGSSYSWIERMDENAINMPLEGGQAEFKVKAFHKPERMALTLDGVSEPEWIDYTIEPTGETDVYNVKLTVNTNPYDAAIDTPLMLMTPGSYVEVNFTQPGNPASASDAVADQAVKVSVEGGDIVVIGGEGIATVYDLSGMAVASAQLNSARTVIAASHLAKGVYVVRAGQDKTCKIVK